MFYLILKKHKNHSKYKFKFAFLFNFKIVTKFQMAAKLKNKAMIYSFKTFKITLIKRQATDACVKIETTNMIFNT